MVRTNRRDLTECTIRPSPKSVVAGEHHLSALLQHKALFRDISQLSCLSLIFSLEREFVLVDFPEPFLIDELGVLTVGAQRDSQTVRVSILAR